MWVLFLHLTVRDLYLSGNRRGRATTSGSADFEGREPAAERTADGWRTGNGGKVGAGGTGEVKAANIVTVGCMW